MEKLLEAAWRRGTCLPRPAPQSKRGLKESEIIRALFKSQSRSDKKLLLLKSKAHPSDPRHNHGENTTKRHKRSRGWGTPPKRGFRWAWCCKISAPVTVAFRQCLNFCLLFFFLVTRRLCCETNSSCSQQNSLGETLESPNSDQIFFSTLQVP